MFEGTSDTEEMGGFTIARWFLFDPGSNTPCGVCLHLKLPSQDKHLILR